MVYTISTDPKAKKASSNYKNRPKKFNDSVLCGDASKLEIFRSLNQQFLLRRMDEACDEKYTITTVEHNIGYEAHWAALVLLALETCSI